MQKYIFSVALALTPLFFWTLTPNLFTTAKELLIIASTTLSLLSLAYAIFTSSKLTLPPLRLTLPPLLFLVTLFSSLMLNFEGRPEALSSRGLILLALLTLTLITSLNSISLEKPLALALKSATSILSLHAILSLTFLSKSPFLPEFMQNLNFTPTGYYPTTLVLILVGFSLTLTLALKKTNFNFNLALATLHFVALVAIVALMLPGGALNPRLLSPQASWSIALDALKSPRPLMIGIGLSNYSQLYTAVKPLNINSTLLWNSLPSSASSEILTLLPTLGVLTTLAFIYLLTLLIIRSLHTPYFFPSLVIALSFLVFPATYSTYFFLFALYLLVGPKPTHSNSLNPTTSKIISLLLLLPAIFFVYFNSRLVISEFYIKQAQRALQAADSQKVYANQQQALKYSPNISNYHLSFAEVNFRLASALSQKQDLTDADREVISQLIQQSITSGKNAITLRPNDSRSWLTLAKIYQNLINVATGSENFALEAYSRALALDRANPALRIEYANLLSQLANSQDSATQAATLRSRAASELQLAIQLKPDYANAYYNLAQLALSTKSFDTAKQALEQTLKYLDQGSTDYARVQSELQTLNNQSATPEPSTTAVDSELTTPDPLPTPLDGGPVELNP